MATNHLRQLREMSRTPSSVQRLLIRYEDLVTTLPAHAERLGNWLGLRLDAVQAPALTERGHRHATSATSLASVGRWRRELSLALAARLWDLLGADLEPLGYTAI
jgi:hypothetical protein